jgi:hypothetical protein
MVHKAADNWPTLPVVLTGMHANYTGGLAGALQHTYGKYLFLACMLHCIHMLTHTDYVAPLAQLHGSSSQLGLSAAAITAGDCGS